MMLFDVKNFNLPINSLFVDKMGDEGINIWVLGNDGRDFNYFGYFEDDLEDICSINIIKKKCFIDIFNVSYKLKSLNMPLGDYKIILLLYEILDEYKDNCISGFVVNLSVGEGNSFIFNSEDYYLEPKGS
jgi:hypothetical protein